MSATNRGTTRQRADFYTTPTGCTAALATQLLPGRSIWEPACGANHITAELQRHGHAVQASDLHDYSQHPAFTGTATWGVDFLHTDPRLQLCGVATSIVTNPPFRLAASFWRTACTLTMPVALLTRVNVLGGTHRVELFSRCPPTHMFTLAPRPSFAWTCKRCKTLAERGQPRCNACGHTPGPGSDATEYCWLVRDPDNHLVRPGPALRFLQWTKLSAQEERAAWRATHAEHQPEAL